MKDLAMRALETAKLKGATYADIRIVHRVEQRITVKNGAVEALSQEESLGFGVRVIADGAWGFASSSLLTAEEVDRVAALAVEIARASALTKLEDVNLGPPEIHVATYKTPVKVDPFSIPLEKKIELLLAADAEMRRTKEVKVSRASLGFFKEKKTFASTEGS